MRGRQPDAQRDPLENPEPLIRRVYAYAAYRVGDGADAEDVTSMTFERALRYRHTYDERRGDPASWLIGIASHCLSDLVAARVGTASTEVPELAAPGDLAADIPSRVDLRRAVAMLSERDRELVALRYGADLTAEQIAYVLGMRTNTVEVALHRLLRALRDILEPPSSLRRKHKRPLEAPE